MSDKKAHDPTLATAQGQLRQPQSLIWSGYAVFIWSIAYMLPHLYWALGGTVGLSLLRPSISTLPEWQAINWVASVFLTAAGLLGVVLAHLKTRGLLRWLLLAITLAGCAVATSHGIYGIIYRILQIVGVIDLESGPFLYEEHAFVLWDLVLFEPWFLVEGILLGILGWHVPISPRARRIWLVLCITGTLAGMISGWLGVRFA
jgi:hypothetical protein